MIRAFAFYFPQLYRIPENDLWWGNGFTDWDLVKDARPLEPTHQQPKVPLHGYRDQSDPQVLAKQAKLARAYGLSGFNFYHYWFNGRVLLDAPIKNLLADPSMDIEFMFTWANESWTRQWIGKPNDYLIEQSYSSNSEGVTQHYLYLRTFFHDARYTKVDGKPVLCIYRPEIIPHLVIWQKRLIDLACKDGFSGIYFLACRSYDLPRQEILYSSFSGIINFNPRYALNQYMRRTSKVKAYIEKYLRQLPVRVQSRFMMLKGQGKRHQSFNYKDYVDCMEHQSNSATSILPVYPSVFPNWDNTARYGKNATFFTGSTPQLFAKACLIAKEILTPQHQNWLFINAWNEWSEAAYLEPDASSGAAYLEALQKMLASDS
jgi:lipopolysaccharide biosynthesis protein